jgi:hypothetical protein
LCSGPNDDHHWVAASDVDFRFGPAGHSGALFMFRIEFERLLRAKLQTAAEFPAAGDFRREFVSDVEAVGDGVATLKYLSRYVFRTAITNNRIVSIKNDQVTFSYKKSGESRDRLMTLSAFEFLRRFVTVHGLN